MGSNHGRVWASPGQVLFKNPVLHHSLLSSLYRQWWLICSVFTVASSTTRILGLDKGNNVHETLAMSTNKRRTRPGLGCWYKDIKEQLDQMPRFGCVAMQVAKVPSPAKAFGQDMLKYPPQEIFAFDRAGLG